MLQSITNPLSCAYKMQTLPGIKLKAEDLVQSLLKSMVVLARTKARALFMSTLQCNCKQE